MPLLQTRHAALEATFHRPCAISREAADLHIRIKMSSASEKTGQSERPCANSRETADLHIRIKMGSASEKASQSEMGFPPGVKGQR